jgi:hypothetical protein
VVSNKTIAEFNKKHGVGVMRTVRRLGLESMAANGWYFYLHDSVDQNVIHFAATWPAAKRIVAVLEKGAKK